MVGGRAGSAVRSGRSVVARVVVVLAASVVLAAVALAWMPGVAAAAEGYSLTSSAVYRFDPAAPAVNVVTTYEMRNTTPDRTVGGGRTQFFYYEGVRLPLDDGVSDLRVQVNGADAPFVQSEVDGLQVLDVEFASRLRYDRTFTIVVSYRLLGDPPRTEDSFVVRDEIGTALGPIDIEPAATIELAYQESTDLEATTAELGTHLAAARRLATARLALVEQLDGLGLDPPAFTQADYDLAPVAAADDVELLEEQAGELVAHSTALDETLAPYALSVPPLAIDAFAESPEDALATVDTNRRAASAVADAYRDRDGAASFLERIGALGSNVDTRLDEAADRLAAGDTEAATASADAAAATLSGWDERGTARLGAVGIGLALGLALALIDRTVRNRRPSDSTD